MLSKDLANKSPIHGWMPHDRRGFIWVFGLTHRFLKQQWLLDSFTWGVLTTDPPPSGGWSMANAIGPF